MKKIILASVAAGALVAGIGAATAAEPGEEAYFHERGNINASQASGPAPGLDGTYAYGYQQERYVGGPLGFAPFFDEDYDN